MVGEATMRSILQTGYEYAVLSKLTESFNAKYFALSPSCGYVEAHTITLSPSFPTKPDQDVFYTLNGLTGAVSVYTDNLHNVMSWTMNWHMELKR